MNSTLQINLFGAPKIQVNGESLPPFLTHKSSELFGYLATKPNRAHPRILLAGLLWPEATDDKARASLSTELWRLKRVLGALNDLLILTRDEVTLSIDSLEIDIHLFKSLSQKNDVESLKHLVSLYSGDFLEGFYEEWCLLEREQLKRIFLSGLENLLRYHEARGEWGEAISYSKKLISYDPLREELHRILIKLYQRIGDRPAAVAQYHLCADYLRRELDIAPMPETQRLYEEIRSTQEIDTLWPTRVDAACNLSTQKILELKRSHRYLPELTVDRLKLDNTTQQFADSKSTGFILIGPSGYGKTTWLASLAETRIKLGDLVLLYDASSLTLNFERDLTRNIWGGDTISISDAFLALGREARYNNKHIWILIDNLNSFHDLGATPADLLRRLNQFISDPELQDAVQSDFCSIKMVIVCREQTWEHIDEFAQLDLNWSIYFGGQPTLLEMFNTDELMLAFQNYSSYFKLIGSLDDLQGETYELCKHPLLLRLLSETSRGKQISIANSETLLFRQYFLKIVPQRDVRQFLVYLVAWMAEHFSTSITFSDFYQFVQSYHGNSELKNFQLKELLDAGILVASNREVVGETFQFIHDRLFEYLLAEYILLEMQRQGSDIEVLIRYAKEADNFASYWDAIIIALLISRNTELFLSFSSSHFQQVRELCVDGLIALYVEEPKLALSISKRILALDSMDAKQTALKALPMMGEVGYEVYYSAFSSSSEAVRRLALISFDRLWRRNFNQAVKMINLLVDNVSPQTVLVAPRKIQTLFRLIGWFSTYDIPRPVFAEIDAAAHMLAVEKLKLPTSESQSRYWPLVKNILARNTVSWPSDEDAISEIVRPDSLNAHERMAFEQVLGTLKQGANGLDDISIENLKVLLQSKIDPARYPAHHQLVLWLYYRPLEAVYAIRTIFDDLSAHARLWLLMSFIPPSLQSSVGFMREVLYLLEELTLRFAEENETVFLHGVESGTLHSLGAVSFLPLGIRYLQAGETTFPLLRSLLVLAKESTERIALNIRLLAPLGWFHPQIVLEFMAETMDLSTRLHPYALEVFASIRVLHPEVVDDFLQEQKVDENTFHQVKAHEDMTLTSYRAHLISTQDVRVTSIILGAPYGFWLADCVMQGYLDSKTPKEASHRFGNGLFEALRQCDWSLKKLFRIPD